MILNILTYPRDEKLLHKKAFKVKSFDSLFRQSVGDLIETMKAHRGLGLAATQCGVNKNVFILDMAILDRMGDKNNYNPDREPVVFVNPRITDPVGEEVTWEECLSVPGRTAEVTRAKDIVVHAQDIMGRPVSFQAKGMLSIVIQHEVDHLNGILFIDRVKPEDVRLNESEEISIEYIKEPA